MERAKTSGRADDNHDSIVKRFRECDLSETLGQGYGAHGVMVAVLGTFTETSMPVVDYYRGLNKVVEVSWHVLSFLINFVVASTDLW